MTTTTAGAMKVATAAQWGLDFREWREGDRAVYVYGASPNPGVCRGPCLGYARARVADRLWEVVTFSGRDSRQVALAGDREQARAKLDEATTPGGQP
jgi:hypothetical protein